MLVTKHAAELCALLVNDLFGELPSRILFALFTKGRSNVAQLAQQTSLGPRHLRHGLAVLIQHNLIFHRTDPDSAITSYDADPDACYNLLRAGKALDVIQRRYGDADRDLVQMLMLLGHARVSDLARAVESRTGRANGQINGSHGTASKSIGSVEQLQLVLERLIQADIVEAVRQDSFRVPIDVYREIEKNVKQTGPGEKISKTKPEEQQRITEQYRHFQDQSRILKRQVDNGDAPTSKRRKLDSSHSARSVHCGESQIDPDAVVRVNPNKCLVELRNQRLADFAAETLGAVTGEVYRTVLELLTEDISRCRPDPIIGEATIVQQNVVTTTTVLDHIGDSVNVQGGIGRAPRDKINLESAELVRALPPGEGSDEDEPGPSRLANSRDLPGAGSGPGDGLEDSDSDDVPRERPHGPGPRLNGDRSMRVKFEDDVSSKDSRLNQLRQHLLLLAESEQRFLRHCGRAGRGQWTVDFKQLMDRVREQEMNSIIEQSFGRHGLRLTRILREKGKLDEKMLPSAALMKKSDVQGKMLAMQMAGLVDVQEVPKDSMRVANRTLFFWFFDGERAQNQLLDDIYKATLRCLQTLQVERYRKRGVLSFVERKDVQGKEEELMGAEHYNKYNQHLEAQEKLLGQVMRLDDMVAVFRDY